jgi:hypothetical protein
MRLTTLEIEAVLAGASQMEDDFESYYQDKKLTKSFYKGLEKLRSELQRRRQNEKTKNKKNE